MTPLEFQATVSEYLPISDNQLEQFEQYYKILVEENEKVNLTAITAEAEVYLKHFFDSMLALIVDIPIETGATIMDVGAGAGFPSIVLKIMRPDLKITILDSSLKRIKFLQLLVEKLGLTDVELVHGRSEDLGQNVNYREKFDVVTARAVANLPVLSELCLPFTKVGGQFIALKGSKGTAELQESKAAIAKLGGNVAEIIQFDLPESAGNRTIILIDKIKPTPKQFPRKAGTPKRSPIK